jgi:hypothetical protein
MEPVLTVLTHLLNTDPEIELLNFFKSYPISIRAKLIAVDAQGNASARVTPPGSVCLYQNKTTILLSNNLPEAVRARVNRFDILEGIVSLNSFSYMGSWTGRRMLVRVQPSHPIGVILEKEDLLIRGQAADLSLNGVGVVVTNPIVKKEDIYKVHLALPSGEIILPGTIIDVIPLTGKNRLSVKFSANSRDIASILKYISGRRTEIQSEVEHMYEKVYQTARA